MSRRRWLEDRRRGIGGSDAAVLLGLSPWKTPYQLYLEKRNEVGEHPGESEAMRWGILLEPLIVQRYADVTGRTVQTGLGILQHPEHAWMLGNVDGLVDDDTVLEAKLTRLGIDFGEEGTDEIPAHYLTQVQHYMAVTGRPLADVAVLVGGVDFRIYHVEADAELQEMLIEAEASFWQRVQEGDPPDPVSALDVQRRWAEATAGKRVQVDTDTLWHVDSLREIRENAKREGEVKAQIMAYMGDADTLVDGDEILATWKATRRGSRRFLLK